MRILTFLIVFAVTLQSATANQDAPAIMVYQWAQDKFQELMKEHGFSNVVNLKGGITAWAEEVDTSMPVY